MSRTRNYTREARHRRVVRAVVGLALTLWGSSLAAQDGLHYADLGRCELESGEVIERCTLAYRTRGRLDVDGGNVVLFPTWYGGTASSMLRYVGPESLVDPERYFIVLPGAFGDGQSSSPSNVAEADFPRFTIPDLVRAQHRLLTEVLGIDRIHAVVGMSMGGMQALEWSVAFPGFAARAASIVGSPRLGSYDALFFDAELRLIEECRRRGCDDTGSIVYTFEVLAGRTPEYWLTSTPRDSIAQVTRAIGASARKTFDAGDVASQIHALLDYDMARPFDGSLEGAAATIRSELLLLVTPRDQMVTPASTRALGRAARVPVVEVGADCGHFVWACDLSTLSAIVREFLDEPSATAPEAPAPWLRRHSTWAPIGMNGGR